MSRVVSNPYHIGKTGIKRSAIPNKHLQTTGLSVVRMGFLPRAQFDEIAFAISALIPPGGNVPAGVLVAGTAAVRGWRDAEGNVQLEVYDDATLKNERMPENPAHALILALGDLSDEDVVEVKTELMDTVFSDLILLQDLRHPDDPN